METLELKVFCESEQPRALLPGFPWPDSINAEVKVMGLDGWTSEPEEFTVEMTDVSQSAATALHEIPVPDIKVPKDFKPGALLVKSKGAAGSAFLLVAVTITRASAEPVEVPCFSWIEVATPGEESERHFFCIEPTLPDSTPKALLPLRQRELRELRGELGGAGKERKFGDRIYEYDVYNDLIAEKSEGLKRRILGGLDSNFPYPRRYRTGRGLYGDGLEEPAKTPTDLYYVPKDDDFKPRKVVMNALGGKNYKDLGKRGEKEMGSRMQVGLPSTFRDHDDFLSTMYEKLNTTGMKEPFVYETREALWKDEPKFADFEFGRQRIAGVNPCTIKAVNKIEDLSPVDNEAIKEILLEGKSLEARIAENRIFTVDYRKELLLKDGTDYILNKINGDTSMKMKKFVYAPACVLYLNEEKHMMPVAVILAAPGGQGSESPVYHLVYTPCDGDEEEKEKTQKEAEWAMAKGHFLAVDGGIHQLYSHFTRCHANSEAYAIATRRNLSPLHPIFRLLMPHFKDTLRINANARKTLINAEGTVEQCFIGSSYSMDLASALYKVHFRFKTEGLPKDLEKRGMASIVKNGSNEEVKLLIDDYPYAQDGLLIWNAIEKWVTKYVKQYYPDNASVRYDQELNSWWDEITSKGHPDIVAQGHATFEEMWPLLDTRKELTGILTTIIWNASGHHAAVNFGQFNYTAYLPTAPSMCSLRMPESGVHGNKFDIDKAVMACLAPIAAVALITGLVQVLSTHFQDEEYLGKEIPFWFQDEEIEKLRRNFQEELEEAAAVIKERNTEQNLPSRNGDWSLPYYLLSPYKIPDTEGQSGVPNSVSI